MRDTLSTGWTRARADRRISMHRKVFGLAILLQLVVGGLFLFYPSFSLEFVGLPVTMGPEWPSIWGATLIFVTVLQIPGMLQPVQARFTNVIAVLGRFMMVATFLAHGGPFLWFAAFDAVFGALLAFGFYRLVMAELGSRP